MKKREESALANSHDIAWQIFGKFSVPGYVI